MRGGKQRPGPAERKGIGKVLFFQAFRMFLAPEPRHGSLVHARAQH